MGYHSLYRLCRFYGSCIEVWVVINVISSVSVLRVIEHCVGALLSESVLTIVDSDRTAGCTIIVCVGFDYSRQ